jgi:predicted RNase H-like HicB family nuclease
MENFIKTDSNSNFIELQLSILVFQEGDYYVSYCPSLELSSYGESVQEAKEGFDEVMQVYLEESQKHGTLHDDLIKHGWKFTVINKHKNVEPPAQVELNIPAGLLKTQFNEKWSVPA